MFRLGRVEFYLPGYDVTDTGDEQPYAVSNTEAKVSRDHVDDVEGSLESFTEAIGSLPPTQGAILKLLEEDIREGRSKLEFNDRTGKVILKDIVETSLLAARIPENTLKVVSAAGKSDSNKYFELNEVCSMINHMKYRRSSSGVALSNKMGVSSLKKYDEGQQYSLLDNILGQGLNAKVTVIKDMKTEEHLASKPIPIHRFQTNEVLSMYDLRNTAICPELCGVQVNGYMVTIYMEILQNCVTVENAIKQLKCSKAKSFRVALFVLIELMEALDIMHNQFDWYHQDLHSANVFIENIQCEENSWRIRIIDFGSVKTSADLKKSRPDYLPSLSLDLENALRQFCALALCGEWFEDPYDFKNNFESTLDKCNESGFPIDLVKEIIKKGFAVKFQQEREYINFLKSRVNTDSAEDITKVFESLSLERQESLNPDFKDIHVQTKGE